MIYPIYKNRPKPELIIGVDESGTGALAGPFTVCAFMARDTDSAAIRRAGARDSKQLTHQRRVLLQDELGPYAYMAKIEVVPGDYTDQRKAWREAIARAVKHCLASINYETLRAAILIDGSVDQPLKGYFERTWDLTPEFIVKGDQLIPQISAASIFAKCQRSELMAEAHKRFPHYGWCNASGKGNDGYGTDAHLKAIEVHGICELHRRVERLLPYFEGKHATQTHGAPGYQ
jgi:ribonuclease HII